MKKTSRSPGTATRAATRAATRTATRTATRAAKPAARPTGTARKAARKDEMRTTGDMRPEYDFRGGVRGKYAARFAKGTNLVVLDPDVAAVFRDGATVNRALRALLEVTPAPRARRSGKRTA